MSKNEHEPSEMDWIDVCVYVSAAIAIVLAVALFAFAWVQLGITQELIDFLRKFVSAEIGAEL